MIIVPAGKFEMGGDRDDWAAPDERGNRIIDISSFSVSQTEVTASQYDACVRARACRAPLFKAENDDYPVTGVAWRDAQSYAAWLSAQTGHRYRLLSEAEWERIARAGTQSRYWWGNNLDPAFGNFGDEYCCRGAAQGLDIFESIAPVRRFKPTPEGFHDLYGNVWEWVQDCYGNYGHAPQDGSAQDPADCRVRVVRGGSYFLPSGFARASARYRLTPGARRPDVGFRVAMDLGTP
ncbi:SUMF1/EgtB/PvdO family nonheme iron enzyme [Rhizobium sp. KVB221]|uniref:SUMF1/EgtB/PvdO family nonheme iron enzyme n=1 Tax=Rhizobium setariae TaxID=2801340 RepID=A0A936YNA2_9HYPH|nr:SUMF1/EgtB/PvdO family nonheme iron enzyme [Rhizobium setariae]MBL0373694.1 SUMF1/EgtB/PvdO family nonheme iron enzyme [Rhizobium setariae]